VLANCPECDARISTAALTCPGCGYPISQPAGYRATPVSSSISTNDSGISLLAMLSSISGCVLLFVPLVWFIAIVPNILGIVLALVSLDRIKRNEASGWGMAIAGLLCGIIGSLLYLSIWLLFQDAVRDAFS
jgi:hypothetical protein